MKSEKPPVQSGPLRHHHLTKRQPILRHKHRPTQTKSKWTATFWFWQKYTTLHTHGCTISL